MKTTQPVHPWHDIEIGRKSPHVVNAVTEIPKGSKVKYELDKKTGMLKLDRHMFSAVHYPGDYGFIPRTLWDDNDPLDVFILGNIPTYPMTLCEIRPIGVIRMSDDKEQDDKIISVHANDPRFKEWNDIKKIPQHILSELRHFLETYKELQRKKVKVYRILGPKQAHADIRKGLANYQAKFGN